MLNELKYKNKLKKYYCCNCGKYGHRYSKCNEPIISLGIIAIKIINKDDYNNLNNFFKSCSFHFNLLKSNSINNNVLLNFDKSINSIKFLLIRRRKTLGYIEFIRGRYNENNINEYTYLFEQMTKTEIEYIKNNDFDKLWHDLWKKKR